MSTEDIDGLDDVENSLLHYNQAIIHYHMRQYSEAIFIGERLYQFLEPFGTFSSLLGKSFKNLLLFETDLDANDFFQVHFAFGQWTDQSAVVYTSPTCPFAFGLQ